MAFWFSSREQCSGLHSLCFVYLQDKEEWCVISFDTLLSSSCNKPTSIKSNDVTDFGCVSARLADLADSDGRLSENFRN